MPFRFHRSLDPSPLGKGVDRLPRHPVLLPQFAKGKVAIIVFAVLGVILFILGIQRVWRRRVLMGSLEGLVGLLLLAIAALMAAISINLNTYDRLTHESTVAEVSFQEIGPQHFGTPVLLKNKTKWQIDAWVLKWREWPCSSDSTHFTASIA
jgi:hypothetical protein